MKTILIITIALIGYLLCRMILIWRDSELDTLKRIREDHLYIEDAYYKVCKLYGYIPKKEASISDMKKHMREIRSKLLEG